MPQIDVFETAIAKLGEAEKSRNPLAIAAAAKDAINAMAALMRDHENRVANLELLAVVNHELEKRSAAPGR